MSEKKLKSMNKSQLLELIRRQEIQIGKLTAADISDETETETENNSISQERPTAEQIEHEIDRHETRQEIKKAIIDTVKNIIVIAAAAVLVANLIISVLVVNRSSMSPSLENGDIIIALRISGVKKGDVAAFYYNNKILVKRIIAEAGDWVNITEDGTVYINEKILDEPYITKKSLGECDIEFPYQVPEGAFFVMGDNRETSADSRLKDIGSVKKENIAGKVLIRLYPISKIKLF